MNNNYSLSSFGRWQLFLSALIILVTFTQTEAQVKNAPPTTGVLEETMVQLDVPGIMTSLQDAPNEKDGPSRQQDKAISLPMSDGGERSFYVVQNDVMSSEFKAAFPELKSYNLLATDDPSLRARMVVSPTGVRATVFTKEGLVDIEPEDPNDPAMHKVRLSVADVSDVQCGTEGLPAPKHKHKDNELRMNFSNGTNKVTYNMAIVTTGEFYELHGSNVTAATAAVTAWVNALEAIYERELAFNFTLLTPFIYTDPANDPFYVGISRPSAAATAVAVNFPNEDTYDMGHVLHGRGNGAEWGGGVVGGRVCNDGFRQAPGRSKAAAWTSLPNFNPAGDLRVFAHEVGHHFSMPHTWNGFCAGMSTAQLGLTNAYEIGSGSTIMSYRDVCAQFGTPQGNFGIPASPNNGDDYFHTAGLEQAVNLAATNATCGTISSTGNTAPVVDANPSACGATYTIPKSTPFRLTGTGSDPDGDQVYYCWEQFDEDGPGSPTQGLIGAAAGSSTIPGTPLFRSYPPTTSPTRTFPAMELVANDEYSSDWEPLPSVARMLKFRLTGRDFKAGGGGIHNDSLEMTVSGNGPFTVSNVTGSFAAGSSTTVSWNLNGFPYSGNMRVKLSIDGGLNYPITLVPSTPAAGGSASVTFPANMAGTTTARIMVESIEFDCFAFFDISNTDFTITNAGCTPEEHGICESSPLTVAPGNAALNLGLSTVYGQSITTFTLTPAGGDTGPIGMNQTPSGPGPGTCTPFFNTGLINVERAFQVTATGDYTFNRSGGGLVSVYSPSFSSASPCDNYVGSASWATGGGNAGNSNSMTLPLTACTDYVIVLKSTTPTDFTVTGLGDFVSNLTSPPGGYNQTYVAVNTATGDIQLESSTSDFTALPAGTYEVYGAHYNGSPTWAGNSLADVLAANCVAFSSNSKQVNVTSGSGPTINISGSPNLDEGNCISSIYTFEVERVGDATQESSVNWVVSGPGADAMDFPNNTFPSGTVTFPVGTTHQNIFITAQRDNDVEPNETFTVTLSDPINGTIGTTTATGTLANDDPLSSNCSGSYCAAGQTGADCNGGVYIGRVELGKFSGDEFGLIDNWSGCEESLPAGYSNYTCFTNEVSKGCNYDLRILVFNHQGGEQVKAWFDWNSNGNFEAGEESTLSFAGGGQFGSQVWTLNFDVPATANLGATRMRVRLANGGTTPVPCGNLANGETEDYCVTVINPRISISGIGNSFKFEGSGGATTAWDFNVTRECPAPFASTVTWTVAGISDDPADGADFVGGSFPTNTVTIPAGSAGPVPFTVNVNGDDDFEQVDQFIVTLSSGTNATATETSGIGFIGNDDGPPPGSPAIFIDGNPVQDEGNGGVTAFEFTITRNGFNGMASSVDWAVTGTSGNQADASDFDGGSFPSGTANFDNTSGAPPVTVTIDVNGDTDFEQNEGFKITLSNPTNGFITNGEAEGVILNDDGGGTTPPVISLSGSPSNPEGNSGTTDFDFVLTRTGDPSVAVNYDITIAGSGANPADADDFLAGVFGTISASLAAGVTSEPIALPVIGDTDIESDEGFTLTLSNVSGASIGTASASGTIINDDGGGGTGCLQTYCAASQSTGGCGSPDEHITNVTFSTISNTSTCAESLPSGYTDYTNLSTTVDVGSTYTLDLTNGGPFGGSQCRVWFDWNADGDFEDAGEEFSPTGSGTNNTEFWTVDVTVPATASVGSTRMRARVFFSGATPPCGEVSYGEAEDYCITIQSSTPPPEIAITPNSADKAEGSGGGVIGFTFTVNRTGDLTGTSSADWAVTGSGANQADVADFDGGTLPSGTVTFDPSEGVKTVNVNVSGDDDVEPDEGFTVTLSNPTNASITTAAADGNIQNDDGGGGASAFALDFDGTDDEVSLPSALGNFGTGDFTVEAYVKTNNATQFIISKRDVCGLANFWNIRVNASGQLDIEMCPSTSGPTTTVTGTTDITDGSWHHIAVTRESGTLKLYVDAVEEGSQTVTIDFDNAAMVRIGDHVCSAFNGVFNGQMDELAFWSVARSQAEITASLTSQLCGDESGLTAYYKFNQGIAGGNNSGVTTLEDETSNNNDGNLLNFALTGTTSNWISDAPGLFPATGCGGGSCTPPTITSVDVTQPTCATPTGSIMVDATGSGTLEYSILSWAAQTSGTTEELYDVWSIDPDNIWAVGGNGTILKYDGISWAAQSSGTSQILLGIWGLDANNIWAVGVGGTVLKYDGSSWSSQTSGTGANLTGIWGADANNVWAVGTGGTILKWDGTSWSSQTSGSTSNLQDIWGADANNVWAVGTGGTILKWDGTNWSSQASGSTTDQLTGIFGIDASNIWVIGFVDILQYDGSNWSTQATLSSAQLYDIFGIDGNNIWATGFGGEIFKFDGTSWYSQVPSSGNFNDGLNAFGGSSLNSLWAVGQEGRILNLAGSNWQPSSTLSGLTPGNYDVAVRLQSDPDCLTNYASNPVVLNAPTGCTPEISISGSPSLDEGNSGSTIFEFTVTRTGSTASPLDFSFSIGGSGTNPADMNDIVGFGATINDNFAAGEASKLIAITVNGDTDVEPDETFDVTLATSPNYTIGTGSATGTIQNDDGGSGGPCLTTLFAGGTGQDGNMFDITNNGTQALTINSFEINVNEVPGTMVNIEVYYTTTASTYVGNEGTAGNWTQLGTATVTSQGNGNPTPLPIGGLVLAPGESKGLYITTDGSVGLAYTAGTSTHDDGTLLIDLDPGIGINYPFDGNNIFSPRQWNGTICYSVGGGGPTAEALDFGAGSDYVSVGDLGSVTDWTIECWFKPNGLNNYENLFHSEDLGSNNGVRVEMSQDFSGGHLYFNVSGNNSGNLKTIVPLGGNLPDQWQHLAIVGDQTNNTVYAYLNGTEVVNTSHTNWPATLPDFVLGRGFSAEAERDFNGEMDEFRIWNYTRSQAEIDCQKDIELTGSEPGLLAYYNFNQGIASGSNAGVTTLDDLTSNNNDGTLTNFALTGTTSNWVEPGPTLTGAPCPSCQPTLNVSGTITSGTYEAQNALTSDGTVPNNSTVELKANNEVLLEAGFEVILGGVLDVIMEGCTPLTGEEEVEQQ